MAVEQELSAEIEAAVQETSQTEGEMKEEVTQEIADEKEKETEEASEEQQETEEAEVDTEEQEEEQEEEQKEEEKVEGQDGGRPSLLPQISDEVLTRAIRAGFSYKEASSFQSDESLAAVCERLEQAERQNAEMDATSEEEEEDPLALLDGLDPEEYEPEVLKVLGIMADQIRGQRDQLRELRTSQESSMQVGQQAAMREVKDWFDERVSSLGPDFHESLGQGVYDALPSGSEQVAKRDAIADVMGTFLAGCRAQNRQPPPREELFERATKLVLADEYEGIKQKELKKKLSARSKQHMQRAGGRGTKTETKDPIDEIAAELDEKYGK